MACRNTRPVTADGSPRVGRATSDHDGVGTYSGSSPGRLRLGQRCFGGNDPATVHLSPARILSAYTAC